MRSKMLGVALAAVLGVCGLARGAEAAAFSFDAFINDTSADGGGNFSFSVDTVSKTGNLSYSEVEQGPVLTAIWYYWNYTGPAVVNSFTSSVSKSVDGYTVKNFSISLSSVGGEGTFVDDEYPNGSFTTKFDSLYADITYTAYYLGDYLADERVSGLPINAYYYGSPLVSIGGDPFVSTVPLPGSAPLFGAALLTLGGIGYARRRGLQA